MSITREAAKKLLKKVYNKKLSAVTVDFELKKNFKFPDPTLVPGNDDKILQHNFYLTRLGCP